MIVAKMIKGFAASAAPAIARSQLQSSRVIFIRLAAAGLGLAAQILASRMLGAEAFGRYSLLLVWLLVLGSASTVGNGQLLCRYVAQYAKANDRDSVAGLLRASLVTVLFFGVLFAGVAIGALTLGLFGIQYPYTSLGVLALCALPLVALQDYLEGIARGLDRPELGIAPAFLVRNLAIIFGLLSLSVMGEHADAFAVMGFTLLGLVATVITQATLLRSHVAKILLGSSPRYDILKWCRTMLPMAGADVTDLLLLNADILTLALFVDPEYVAFYFAATRLAQILGYVPYGAKAATAQKYATLAAKSERNELQSLIAKTAKASTILTALGAVVLISAADPLLSLFGEDFTIAAPAVALLCIGIVFSCAFGPGEDVLNMLGQERICSLVFLLSLTINVALNFALIPHFGLEGSALATCTALVSRAAILAYFAKTRLGLVLPAFLSSQGPVGLPGNQAAGAPARYRFGTYRRRTASRRIRAALTRPLIRKSASGAEIAAR